MDRISSTHCADENSIESSSQERLPMKPRWTWKESIKIDLKNVGMGTWTELFFRARSDREAISCNQDSENLGSVDSLDQVSYCPLLKNYSYS
jgi:hypothetical protein